MQCAFPKCFFKKWDTYWKRRIYDVYERSESKRCNHFTRAKHAMGWSVSGLGTAWHSVYVTLRSITEEGEEACRLCRCLLSQILFHNRVGDHREPSSLCLRVSLKTPLHLVKHVGLSQHTSVYLETFSLWYLPAFLFYLPTYRQEGFRETLAGEAVIMLSIHMCACRNMHTDC